MRGKKKVTMDSILNKVLMPAGIAYALFKKIAKKTKKSVPFVYDEVEHLIKSNLITLEKDEKLLHSPDIRGFADVVTSNIARKLPNMSDAKLKQIVSDKSSLSFLDMLTRGLGEGIEEEKDYTSLGKGKLFKRVLIANRGEISLRVIRACRELGISPIVVYSSSDKDSLAVKFADKAYCVGTNNNYLNTKKIIDIAKKAKADAIHPGYGFLAENALFASMCQKNGIKFIGPSVKAINMMGDKILARNAMIKSKVPIIPGTIDAVNDKERALEIAHKIGYPIIIKAAAGGGGKGMRIVRSDDELDCAFDSAGSEAEASFGNNELYIEKYFDDPRHIEFQVLSDKYGNAIHLGERDCSIQRRHQKLIEEAPSPALNKKLREEMGNIAVNVAKASNYEGAGTVEFLFDDKTKEYFFMEMNTRIQVEHGITEMITGVDLVKEQIKIAAGARMVFSQDDIVIRGWAIECRINAEDPSDGFKPSSGSITNYLPPGGPGIRVCSGCHSGHIVSPHYDSLIAKLMCGGRNRYEAIARMKRALSEFIIEGIDTTIPFHLTVLSDKNFMKGNVTTSFIDKNKIIEQIKRKPAKKQKLTNGKKAIIVSTAVAEYMKKKYNGVTKTSRSSAWVSAGRQDAMNNDGRAL